MSDLIQRLRRLYVQNGTDYVQEAADTIERLQATIQRQALDYLSLDGQAEALRERAERAEAELAEIADLLSDERYADSKDWRHSTLAGRVEWLHSMYANRCAEASHWLDTAIRAQDRCAATGAERDALRADAERYRLIRSRDFGPSQVWELISDDAHPPCMTLKCGEALDAAIDAARSKT